MSRYLILLSTVVILAGCSQYSAVEDQSSIQDQKKGFYGRPTQFPRRSPLHVDPKAVAEPNGLLTLRDAVGLTLLHNPELKAYAYDIRAAEARHLQAGLWQNPELELELENFGGSGEFSGLDSAETTIQLSQIIELGDKVNKRQQVFAYEMEAAKVDYHAQKLDIVNELTQSFIVLLLIQEKTALSEELVNISQDVVHSVEKRVQAGKAGSIELSRAKVALAEAKLQQLRMTGYLDVTRMQLASYWNSRNPAFTEAAGRLDALKEVPDFQYLRARLQNHPEMIRSAIAVRKRKAQTALADAGAVPDLKVAGGFKHFKDPGDTAFLIGLSIPLSISDRNQGWRMEAVHQYQKARELRKVTSLTIWIELNRLYADLQTAYTTASILRDEVMPASQEIFDAVKVSYEQGKKDYLELLDSQRVYFTSQNDYLDALMNYHVARTELERLIGQSLENINLPIE